MKGISNIIVVLVLLLIVVSLASSLYLFLMASAGSTEDITAKETQKTVEKLGYRFAIDSVGGDKIYARNTGTNKLNITNIFYKGAPLSFNSSKINLEPKNITIVTLLPPTLFVGGEGNKLKLFSTGGYTVETASKLLIYDDFNDCQLDGWQTSSNPGTLMTADYPPFFDSVTYSVSNAAGYWSLNESSGQMSFDNFAPEVNNLILGTTTAVESYDPIWVGGIFQSALQFDGIDDGAVVPNSSFPWQQELEPRSGDFTLEAWIYITGPPAGLGWIISKGSGGGTYGYGMGIDGSYRLFCSIYGNPIQPPGSTGYNQFEYSVTTLQQNQWNHVACVFKRTSNLELYVNSVLDKAASLAGNTGAPDTSLLFRLGRHQFSTPGSGWFKGKIDEPVIYRRALPLSEIQQHYNKKPPVNCALKITDNSATYRGDAGVNFSLPISTGKITAKFKAGTEQTSNKFMILQDSRGDLKNLDTDLNVSLRSNGNIGFWNPRLVPPNFQDMTGYTTGRWYNITLDIDADKEIYDIFIDGIKRAANASFIAPTLNLNGIAFAIGISDQGTFFIDDISVTQN